MNLRRLIFSILCILAWQLVLGQESLTIAVASNFREPMTKISDLFEKEHPEVAINLVFGSSGNLYHQITKKAPYDLFFSANTNFPKKIFEAGMSPEPPIIYARGQLVIWSRKAKIDTNLRFLLLDKLKKIAIANPELAPYGLAAINSLDDYDIRLELNEKLVIAENIGQAAQFAATGNVDAAFLSLSQMKSEVLRNKGTYKLLPLEVYEPIEQGCVLIDRKEPMELPMLFFEFIKRENIKQLVRDYGYLTE